MRRMTMLLAMLTLAGLVSTSHAGIFRWRLSWRQAQQPVYSQRQVNHHGQHAKATTSAAPVGQDDATPVAHGSTSRVAAPETAVRQYRSLDERRVAELGPKRARMVYPNDAEVDPYPACRAWKWDDDDGWGWDWSELNCPWKQSCGPWEFDTD